MKGIREAIFSLQRLCGVSKQGSAELKIELDELESDVKDEQVKEYILSASADMAGAAFNLQRAIERLRDLNTRKIFPSLT